MNVDVRLVEIGASSWFAIPVTIGVEVATLLMTRAHSSI